LPTIFIASWCFSKSLKGIGKDYPPKSSNLTFSGGTPKSSAIFSIA